MRQNNKCLQTLTANQFIFPDNQSFLKMCSKYKTTTVAEIEYFKKDLINYPNIFPEKSRPALALNGLRVFSMFLRPANATFRLKTALEGLLLIFLIDDIADNPKYPLSYRKKFLKNFSKFIKNIGSKKKAIIKDIRQEEMQKIWLNHFNRIYCKPGLKGHKWIRATQDFIRAMMSEYKKNSYKTLEKYLNVGIISSGAIFFWQSIITDAGYAKQNNSQYDKLIWQIAKILRLTNDFAQTKEDKKKITALNFLSKKELKKNIEKEIAVFQKMLQKSYINMSIRQALWRSAIFLYYFYQKNNF